MSFPQNVSDKALTACGRCCCICHKFCGTKIELHHIKQVAYGGEDTFENCIPLCFDCHADMGKADPKHNKGKKYTEEELKLHRDNWYCQVANGATGIHDQSKTDSIDEMICNSDKALFDEICKSFSSKIQFALSNHEFYYPYERNMFNPLDYLLYRSNDPAYFFLNQELEEMRIQLFKHIGLFTEYIYTHTYPVNNDLSDKNAPHAWLLNHDYIRETTFHKDRSVLEREFDQEVERINTEAEDLWASFSEFVKKGRMIINR